MSLLGGTVNYETAEAPSLYCCSMCGASGVKLWRPVDVVIAHLELLCVDDALRDQKLAANVAEDGSHRDDFGRSDQIGALVPAVPVESGETFWNYTVVPAPAVAWWKRLPLHTVS